LRCTESFYRGPDGDACAEYAHEVPIA